MRLDSYFHEEKRIFLEKKTNKNEMLRAGVLKIVPLCTISASFCLKISWNALLVEERISFKSQD